MNDKAVSHVGMVAFEQQIEEFQFGIPGLGLQLRQRHDLPVNRSRQSGRPDGGRARVDPDQQIADRQGSCMKCRGLGECRNRRNRAPSGHRQKRMLLGKERGGPVDTVETPRAQSDSFDASHPVRRPFTSQNEVANSNLGNRTGHAVGEPHNSFAGEAAALGIGRCRELGNAQILNDHRPSSQ